MAFLKAMKWNRNEWFFRYIVLSIRFNAMNEVQITNGDVVFYRKFADVYVNSIAIFFPLLMGRCVCYDLRTYFGYGWVSS